MGESHEMYYERVRRLEKVLFQVVKDFDDLPNINPLLAKDFASSIRTAQCMLLSSIHIKRTDNVEEEE